MRCLKRYVAREVYKALVAGSAEHAGTIAAARAA